jgi:hypothetical protein
MRPGLERFSSDAAAAGLWFTFRPAVKQRYARAAPRQPLRCKRAGWSSANNQDIKMFTHTTSSSLKFRLHHKYLPGDQQS